MAIAIISRSDKYRAAVQVPGFKKQYKTFAKKSEAKKWATDLERTLKRNSFSPESTAETVLVADAINIYIRDVTPTKAESNRKDETNKLNEWIRHIGAMRLIDLTADHIFTVLQKQKNQGPTKNRKLGTLSAVMTYFTKAPHRWLENNPCHDVKRWPENPGRDRILTAAEWDTLIQCADERAAAARSEDIAMRQLPIFLRLLYWTGCRKGEALRLTVGDVNWSNGITILTGKAKNKVTGEQIKRPTKLSEELLEMLSSYDRGDSDLLFPGRLGNACSFRSAFDDVLEITGLENVGFHTLRHTAITEFARKCNGDIVKLQKFSGHLTLSMLNRYIHTDEDDIHSLFDER